MKKYFFSFVSVALLLGFISESSVFAQQDADHREPASKAVQDTVMLHGKMFKDIGGSDWRGWEIRTVYTSIDRSTFSVMGYYNYLECLVVGGKVKVSGYVRMKTSPGADWKGSAEVPLNPSKQVDVMLRGWHKP